MLRTILEFEQNDSRKDSAQIALVAHCLAMLWFLGGDALKVSHLTRLPGITEFDTLTQFPIYPLCASFGVLSPYEIISNW